MILENDRAVKKLTLDADVQAVLEFMQDNVSTGKLIAVADLLPQMARLLWSNFQQEPIATLRLQLTKPRLSQLAAIELPLGQSRVDDGSVVEAGAR